MTYLPTVFKLVQGTTQLSLQFSSFPLSFGLLYNTQGDGLTPELSQLK